MYIATRLPNGLAFCDARYTAPFSLLGSSGVVIVTSPIFDAFGQKFTPGSRGSVSPAAIAAVPPGTLGVNRGLLTPGSVSTSPKALKPTSPSEHASSPSAPAGLMLTPSGKATVMSLMFDCASPMEFSWPSWETCTSVVNPLGVLACCPSGASLISGLNGSALQPSRLCIGSPGNDLNTPGSSQESPSRLVRNGPVHDVGSDRNGGGWDCSEGVQGSSAVSPRACVRQP